MGRYRVAISSSRLIGADEQGVTFKCKDDRSEGPAGRPAEPYGSMLVAMRLAGDLAKKMWGKGRFAKNICFCPGSLPCFLEF
jgi:hypothetical protein